MKTITKSIIIIAALSAAISCNRLSISSPDGSLTVTVFRDSEDGKEIVSESSDSKQLKLGCLPRGGFVALVER